MKKDKLENFIVSNKNEFYNEIPPFVTWEKIENNLPVKKTPSLPRIILRYAAAALILVSVTFAATRFFLNNQVDFKASSLCKENKMQPRKIIVIEKQIKTYIQTGTNDINENENNFSQKELYSIPENGLYNDIEEINVYYKSKIYERKTEIIRLASVSGEINQQVDVEITQMDSIYKSIIKDLKDNVNNREVVEGLIMQYRLKLEFLDNVLMHIKENESTSTQNPVKND